MNKALVVVILVLAGCRTRESNSESQILDFGSFTIVTPKGWTKIKEKGTDSYVGKIAIDNLDTLEFDLGWYSNTLSENEPQILERSMIPLLNRIDTTQYIIVETTKGIDRDKYKKNNISWDSIDGRLAKIVYPIRTGIGTTGIYIDSLWQAGPSVDRFNLYGEDLSPGNQKLVLSALKTLKFKRRQ